MYKGFSIKMGWGATRHVNSCDLKAVLLEIG